MGDTTDGEPPYAMRRDAVQENREKIPVWLQDQNKDRLDEVKDEVESILGYDVYQTDFKEAAILHGLANPLEIATQLEEWGCEYA
jgi:hypothetical protein